MKEFVVPLLGAIFVLLLADSVGSVDADHLEPGIGIFKDENKLNTISSQDSKYDTHLLVEVRNAQGQLISITEERGGYIIPHKMTDDVFDTLLGEKEFVTIDNIKYEQVKFSGMLDMEQLMKPANRPSHFIGYWHLSLCQVFDTHGYTCVAAFAANTSYVSLVEDDIVENHWIILRIIS
jgi:hypothetical protein